MNQQKLQRFSVRFSSRRPAVVRACLPVLLLVASATSLSSTQPVPFSSGEKLTYEITWPSGLGLGEVTLQARTTTEGWEFDAKMQANLPTQEILGEYHSSADASLCSLELKKKTSRGDRETEESVVYDQTSHRAERKTVGGGGESELDIPPCGRDALAFLYFLRRELGLGRIPPPDDINFGAQYQISMTYAASLEIPVAGEQQMADRILIDVTGPASQHSFEVFFGRDDARTPLLMRVPLELGTFSLKLVK